MSRFPSSWGHLLVVAVATLWATEAACKSAPQTGVILALGKLDARPLLAEAERQSAVRWRAARLAAANSPTSAASNEGAIAEAELAYLEADFLRCLVILQRPALANTWMLDDRDFAARWYVLSAACAHGAGEVERATQWLQQALIQQLPMLSPLRKIARPDFQQLVERVRRQVRSRRRVQAVIRTQPKLATLRVDGVQRCARTPCSLRLASGEHVFSLSKLGHQSLTVRREVGTRREVRLSLVAASAREARGQLSGALALGPTRAIDEAFARVAANAYSTGLLLLVWQQQARVYCIMYARNVDRIVARVSSKGGNTPIRSAVVNALRDWQRQEPVPFYRRPVFYVGVVGVAVAAGLITYFATRDNSPREQLVFE